MAILSPPPFVQGGSHSSKQVRQFISALTGQPVETFVNSVGAVGPAHGLVSVGDLAVVQAGTPNMSVNVGVGRAFISGDLSLVQGAYVFTNDAVQNVVIATADASNGRRDLVCAQVRETIEDSSGQNDARLFVATGTPSATPVDPAIPDGCLVLARVTVAALSTSVVNANITNVALLRSRGDGMGLVFHGTGSQAFTADQQANVTIDTEVFDIGTVGAVGSAVLTIPSTGLYVAVLQGSGAGADSSQFIIFLTGSAPVSDWSSTTVAGTSSQGAQTKYVASGATFTLNAFNESETSSVAAAATLTFDVKLYRIA